ncbi:MAG: LLM class flavin-dependent oxidoreductase [Chloroflexi bacterium]|nr:LLM class flavin-dependent oxidoreductase [Chloroflexota bacterium]
MRQSFGILFAGDDLPEWQEYVQTADACSFWGLGVGDSQSIYPDVYVRCTIAAMQTRHMRLGPWVTNPLTRHPAVTAGAIASVDQVSGGRAFLGIGTGDSAVFNISRRPSSVTYLEDYVRAVNDLLAHGEAQWNGQTLKLAIAKRRVPVYIAASGPKTLRMAGRIADGVVVGTGVLPEVVRGALADLRAGAEEAGRSVEDIDVWWLAMANLAEDDATALNEIKNSLVTYANLAFRFTTEGKHLPPEYESAVQRIHAEYRPLEHAKFGPSHHARLADELGLTPYLARRFSVCGAPEAFVRRVAEVHAAGAEKVWLSVRVADKRRFLRLWNTQVRPHFE